MSISKIIKLITFIPWILYYVEIMYYRIAVLERYNLDRESYFKYLNKNFFKAINVKELVLFFIFIVFSRFENTLVLELYFPAVYFYLLIDFFHTLAKDCTKINYKMLMVLAVSLAVFYVILFIITNHLFTTYDLMFITSLLSSFVIYLFSLCVKK